jgi:predicted small secreted protein
MKTAILTSALVVAAITLGSCQWVPGTKENDISKGRDAAAAILRDPSSAQFREVIAVDHKPGSDIERAVCGQINGKNAHGAYAGFTRFVADPSGGKAALDPETGVSSKDLDDAQDTCQRAVSDAERSGFTDLARMQCDRFREAIDRFTEQSDFETTYETLCTPAEN